MKYHDYFYDSEVKDEFKKEFISLWPGWLGVTYSHKLDEVTEKEWSKFNGLIRELAEEYKLLKVEHSSESLIEIDIIDEVLVNYEESMNKNAEMFDEFFIKELDCIITEDWDYTYIIWYKDEDVIDKLHSHIESFGLFHFEGSVRLS